MCRIGIHFSVVIQSKFAIQLVKVTDVSKGSCAKLVPSTEKLHSEFATTLNAMVLAMSNMVFSS